MEIKRIGSQPSGKGPADWFTGTVRIDPMFDRTDPARVSGATVTFEPALKAAKASQGVQTTADGGLVWTVDSLAPRAQQTWSVQCTCVAPTQRACGKVTLTDQTGLNFGEETCLQIVPGQAAPGISSDLVTPRRVWTVLVIGPSGSQSSATRLDWR